MFNFKQISPFQCAVPSHTSATTYLFTRQSVARTKVIIKIVLMSNSYEGVHQDKKKGKGVHG